MPTESRSWLEWNGWVDAMCASLDALATPSAGYPEHMAATRRRYAAWHTVAEELDRERTELHHRVAALEAQVAMLTGVRDEFDGCPRLTDDDEVDLTDERFAEDARAFYAKAVREGGRG